MNLVQYLNEAGETRIARVFDGDTLAPLETAASLYDFALQVLEKAATLKTAVEAAQGTTRLPYETLLAEGRILSPITHPDPAHLLVTGTGLTHLGSADTRDAMHAKLAVGEASLTDSMKMFRMGLEGGKPDRGQDGVQPEWFYKGDGGCVARPGGNLASPGFALDGGEEPEIAGIYVIAPDGRPRRLGFCLGNEFSDHRMEKINYLYLAHSKLRPCAIGPELRLGDLPTDIRGTSKILRDGKPIWEKPFASGVDNMSHSIANLEAHHFKYAGFRRPGDVHVHFFGTATLSFADGIETQPGDTFEISAEGFGAPLRNNIVAEDTDTDFRPLPL
ncbi:MAG: AraD1 family protein [Henriciella sp.]|uniref:AraD1 family protein n=1 Tax=Henriciella sp. TaxID=1968823 RepID=UPI003C779953